MSETKFKARLAKLIEADTRCALRIEPGMGSTIGVPDMYVTSPTYDAWLEIKMCESEPTDRYLTIKTALRVMRYPQLQAALRLARCGQRVMLIMVGAGGYTMYRFFSVDHHRHNSMDKTGEIAELLPADKTRLTPPWLRAALEGAHEEL